MEEYLARLENDVKAVLNSAEEFYKNEAINNSIVIDDDIIGPYNASMWETLLHRDFLRGSWAITNEIATEERKRIVLELVFKNILYANLGLPWRKLHLIFDLSLFFESKGT